MCPKRFVSMICYVFVLSVYIMAREYIVSQCVVGFIYKVVHSHIDLDKNSQGALT